MKAALHAVWPVHKMVSLTRELCERCVRLKVKTLPVLIEGLHAELAGLLYGPHGDFSHNSIYVMATANLQDNGESQNIGHKITGRH